MPVSGLIVTLRCEETSPPVSELVRRAAEELPFVEFGDRVGARVAVVIDGDSYAEHDARLEALRDHRDVGFVDLVSHDFSDVETFGEMPRRRRPHRSR